MNDDADLEQEFEALEAAMIEERRRETAVEHLLFKTMEYVERQHPGLLDYLEASLPNLGDPGGEDQEKDDEAVRTIARKMIHGARRQG